MENDHDIEMNDLNEIKKEEYNHKSLSNDISTNGNISSSLKRKLELFDMLDIDHESSPNHKSNSNLNLSKLKPSLFINLFNDGYSFANVNNNKIYPYNDKDSKIFLDALSQQKLVPELIDLLDEVQCTYYNGCIVVDIKDFRGTSSNNNGNNSNSSNTDNNIQAKRVILKPEYQTILFDIQKEGTESLKSQINTNSQEILDDCLLNFERLFLKVSNVQLNLSNNNGLQSLYQKNIESYNSGNRYLFDFKRIKSNNYEYVCDTNDFRTVPYNTYQHHQNNIIQNNNFSTNSSSNSANSLQQPFFKRNSTLPDSIDANNFSLFRLITSNVNLIENDRRSVLQYYKTVEHPITYPCSYQYQTFDQTPLKKKDKFLESPTKPPLIQIAPKLSHLAEQLKSRMIQYISTNNLLVVTYEVRTKGTMYYLYSFISENIKMFELIRQNQNYQIQMIHYQNTLKQIQVQRIQQQQQQQQQQLLQQQQQQQASAPQTPTTPQSSITQQSPTSQATQQTSTTPQLMQSPTPQATQQTSTTPQLIPSTQQTPNVQSPVSTSQTPQIPTPPPPSQPIRIAIDGEINFDNEIPKPTCFIYPIGTATQAVFFINRLKNCFEKDSGFALNFDSYLPHAIQQNHTNNSENIRKRVELKYYPQSIPQVPGQPPQPTQPQIAVTQTPQQTQTQPVVQYQPPQIAVTQQGTQPQLTPQAIPQILPPNLGVPMVPMQQNIPGVVATQPNMIPNFNTPPPGTNLPNGMVPNPQQIQLQQQQNVQQNVQQIIQQHQHQHQIQQQQFLQQQQLQIQQLQQQKQYQQQLQNKI